MSKNNILASVPTFDGSNYRRWADRMKAYLQMFNLWGVTNGDEVRPEDLTPRPGATESAPPIQPTAAEVAEQKKLQKAWSRDNKAAIGTMALKIREDLWTLKRDTMEEMWENMEEIYGSESQAQKFQWLKELFWFKLPGVESPHKEFGRWDVLVDKLTKANMILRDEVLCSILMETIPAVYKSTAPLFLAAITKKRAEVVGDEGSLHYRVGT
jgi:hypothetical protein